MLSSITDNIIFFNNYAGSRWRIKCIEMTTNEILYLFIFLLLRLHRFILRNF